MSSQNISLSAPLEEHEKSCNVQDEGRQPKPTLSGIANSEDVGTFVHVSAVDEIGVTVASNY